MIKIFCPDLFNFIIQITGQKMARGIIEEMITTIRKMIIPPSLTFRRDPAKVINEGGTVMRGQSITEYAVFITVVVMALLAMQIYLKRGLQGKIKDMADKISPALYDPNTTLSNFSTNTSTYKTTDYIRGVLKTDLIWESTNKSGVEIVYPETK